MHGDVFMLYMKTATCDNVEKTRRRQRTHDDDEQRFDQDMQDMNDDITSTSVQKSVR